jgi:hypothetical protein
LVPAPVFGTKDEEVDADADADADGREEKNVRPILGVSAETSILRAAPPRGRAFRVREKGVRGITDVAVAVAVVVAAQCGARRGRMIRIDT